MQVFVLLGREKRSSIAQWRADHTDNEVICLQFGILWTVGATNLFIVSVYKVSLVIRLSR